MTPSKRRLGPIGTTARVLVGLALIYVSGAWGGLDWSVEAHDLVVGLVALPAISLSLGLAARRYADGPVRFDGPLGIAVNCAVIVALIANDYTGGGATLFYGLTLLIAAWRACPAAKPRCSRTWSWAATTRSAARRSRRSTGPRHGYGARGRQRPPAL
jgi:hypothetical protein